MQNAAVSDRTILESQVEGLARVAQAHSNGMESYARSVAISLFEDFLLVEERFAANKEATEQEVIDSLRKVSSTTICYLQQTCDSSALQDDIKGLHPFATSIA